MSLTITLAPAVLSLPPRDTQQAAYALLTIAAGAGGAAAPVNWALLADASRSMRIPIVSEEQFRELVRQGGAQEVLVDGVPVWQLPGPVPAELRASAPSALDHTARALHSILERLDREDRFSLVACAEQALLVVPATSGDRRAELAAGVARLRSLRLGEETDLAAGLRVALEQLAVGSGAPMVSRVILLTDGFTRYPESCLELARGAATRGISVSTLGLGGEFQDDLLTRLADAGGGRASFLRRPDEIPAAVAAELDAARGVVARSLTLDVVLPQGARLRYATRLSPSLAPLEWDAADERQARLYLGDLQAGAPIRLLLELLAPPAPPRPMPGGPRVRVAALRAASGASAATADLIVHYTPEVAPPAPQTMRAVGQAHAARLQRRAAQAAAAGDQQGAATMLQAAAARLAELGQADLAAAARREAEALATTGQGTGVGARELTYATRRLGEHEPPG